MRSELEEPAQDAALSPLIERRVAMRPTHGDRRITAVLNRTLRGGGPAPVNQQRVYRIMKPGNLLLTRTYTERLARGHEGKVTALKNRPCRPLQMQARAIAPARWELVVPVPPRPLTQRRHCAAPAGAGQRARLKLAHGAPCLLGPF